MYVQPTDKKSPYTGSKNVDFFVPEGYSGHAFDMPATDITEEPAAPVEEETPCIAAVEAPSAEPEKEAEAVPAGGLLGRFPLLSSLLPPRRGRRGGSNDLLFLGFLFFLLREDGENDLLPLLLLLLFWN